MFREKPPDPPRFGWSMIRSWEPMAAAIRRSRPASDLLVALIHDDHLVEDLTELRVPRSWNGADAVVRPVERRYANVSVSRRLRTSGTDHSAREQRHALSVGDEVEPVPAAVAEVLQGESRRQSCLAETRMDSTRWVTPRALDR